MARKVQRNGRKSGPDHGEVEALYEEFLTAFYDAGDRGRAEAIAPRLEKAVAGSPAYAGTIRAEEIRALLAELKGDYVEAARSREAEVRKILELHTLAVNTPGWPYVSRRYDFGDVSDRLDLLAVLYDKQGETDRAIAVLQESEQYCKAHNIPFDGQDLLDELQGVRKSAAKGGRIPAPRRRARTR